MKKILFLFLVLNILPILAYSQKNKKPVKKDSVEVIEVQVFNSTSNDVEKEYENEKNILKFGLFNILNSDIPIYYERVLNNNFSLELGLGLNFGKNLFSKSLELDDYNPYYSIDKYKIGTYSSLNLKYFPSKRRNIPEGIYLSLGMQYKVIKFVSENANNINISLPDSKINYFDYLRLNVGYVRIYDNFYSEYSLGVGIRKENHDINYIDSGNNIVTSNFEGTHLILLVSYKLGFTF